MLSSRSAGMGLVVRGVWGQLVRISTALVSLSVLLGCAAIPPGIACPPRPGSPEPIPAALELFQLLSSRLLPQLREQRMMDQSRECLVPDGEETEQAGKAS